MQDEDFAENVREKISTIPGFPKSTIDSLLKVWSAVTDRRKERVENKINKIVDSAYNRHVLNSTNPVISFPSKKESEGDVMIGNVCAGDQVLHPFGLSRVNITENVAVFARAGHGKTSLVINVVDQFIKKVIKFVIPDWKNDYGFLAKKYDGVYIIKWNQIKFNPWTNIPSGMKRNLWWNIILDVLSHSMGLLMATPSHILEVAEQIYEDKKGLVTFKDIEIFLKRQNEDSKKRSEYADVALNRIFYLNQTLDEVINVPYGYDIKELFSQKGLVIEMSPLHYSVASWLFQCMVLWEFNRRLHNNVRLNRNPAPDEDYLKENMSVSIMDEAHLSQYGPKENSLVSTEYSPPPFSTFFSQGRELMMSTFALTQFPQLLYSTFKDNAGTRIVGNITESDLRRDLAASLGLERDDEKLLGRLAKGYWIVTVAGRTKPFLMRTPVVEKPVMAEEELLESSRQFLTKLQIKQKEVEERLFHKIIDGKNSEGVALPTLSKEEWSLLDYIFHNEWKYQKEIADNLGFSDRKFAQAKRSLVEKRLVAEVRFPVRVHERIHFALTPNGLDVMKTVGKNPQRVGYWRWLTGKPGYEHHYWVHVLRVKHVQLGFSGRVEYDLKDGRRVDLLETKENFWRAIEIELSTRDVENKVRIIKDNMVSELVLLYKDETTLQFVRTKLEEMKDIPGNRIWVGLIRDYVDILDGMINSQLRTGAERSGNEQKPDVAEREAGPERKQSGNNGGNSN